MELQPVQTKWFSHLPKDKQEDFKKMVLGSTKVLDRLLEICYNVTQNRELTLADYDSPSWAFKAADRQGYLRAYREISEMLNFSDHEK